MRSYKLQSAVLLLVALGANAVPVSNQNVKDTISTTSDPDPNFAYFSFKREEPKKSADNAADPDPNFAYFSFKREEPKKSADNAQDPDPNFAYFSFKKRE